MKQALISFPYILRGNAGGFRLQGNMKL